MLYALYGIVIAIVLINLLIAIMNDTFDRVRDAEQEQVLRNKARIVVGVHCMMTRESAHKLEVS